MRAKWFGRMRANNPIFVVKSKGTSRPEPVSHVNQSFYSCTCSLASA